jgi:rod shape-determining protein MreD
MKVVFRVALVVTSAAVLQVGLFSQLPVAGVRAMVLLLLAITGGMVLGPDRGAIIGFIAGLVFDLLLVTPLGLCALVFCLCGFVAGRFQSSVTRSSRWRLMVNVGVGSAMGYGLLVVVGWVLGQHNMLSDRLPVIVLVVSVMNALLAPLAMRAVRWAWDQPRITAGVGYGY